MKKVQWLLCVTSLAMLGGCGGGGSGGGGGGGGGATVGAAQGVYEGTATSGAVTNSIQGLVLEDDSFWIMYGTSSAIKGFLQGQGLASNGTFTSSSVKDFGVIPASSFTLTSTYSTVAHTVSGSVSSGANTGTFSMGPIASNSLYVYDSPANINSIAGAWTLTAIAGGTISAFISNSGGLGAVVNGCTLSGPIAPRSSGKNVFNLSLTEGAAPCTTPGKTYSGIALVIPQVNGTNKLTVTYIDAARTLGGAAFGSR